MFDVPQTGTDISLNFKYKNIRTEVKGRLRFYKYQTLIPYTRKIC